MLFCWLYWNHCGKSKLYHIVELFHADGWFLLCDYFFCSNAASTCVGSWSAYTFTVDSRGIKFENAIAFLVSMHHAHFDFLVHILDNVSAPSSICKLHHCFSDLLFLCKWVHNSTDLCYPTDLLCGCHHTCFHQDKVG